MTITDPRGVWVKICGVTTPDDAEHALSAGASAIGLVFTQSPRRVTGDAAQAVRDVIPEQRWAVGVFAEDIALASKAAVAHRLDAVQVFSGYVLRNMPDTVAVMRTIRLADARDVDGVDPAHGIVHIDAYDLHAHGGTGRTVDWAMLAENRPPSPFVLAGGLTPDNVADAIRAVRPDGVDVSSGVEREPGHKDHAKVEAFIQAAREAAG